MQRKSTQQTLARVAWQRGMVTSLIVLAIIGVLSQMFMVVDASSFASGGTTSFRASQTFSDDVDLVVTARGVSKIGSTATASRGAGAGVEATSALPAVNTPLNRGNYAYQFDVKESSPAGLRAGERFRIEVYADYGSSTPLLAAIYMQQVTADDTSLEGLTITVDVGSSVSIPDRFDIIVTRL